MNLNSPAKLSLFDRFFTYVRRRGPGDRFVFLLVLLIFIGSSVYLANSTSKEMAVPTPTTGGVIREGLVGTPRFINPVLAFTRADKDMTALVYRGLVKLDPEGVLVPDLAESVTVSADGLTYNVVLRANNTFHDGAQITAADVAFTIQLIQEPSLKSPHRGDWSGANIEVISDTELNIVIEEPHPPFMENLTLGIMPKHNWDNLSPEQFQFSQNNTNPIGSGYYKINKASSNNTGQIESYELVAHRDELSSPKIEKILITFFDNEAARFEAFAAERIDSLAITSNTLVTKDITITDSSDSAHVVQPLPIMYEVFFNQNKSLVLRDTAVREALHMAIDREEMVEALFQDTAFPTDISVPFGFYNVESTDASSTTVTTPTSTPESLLQESGWERNDDGLWIKTEDESELELRFALTTENRADYLALAEFLVDSWSGIGIPVTIEAFDRGDIEFSIISPRDYESLLYGINLERQLDLYSFWHSSQKDDPGRNVALYTNITTDSLLSNMRSATSTPVRNELISQFLDEVAVERPSIPLFNPGFVYLYPENLKLEDMHMIEDSSQRFSNIDSWYIEQESLWPLFVN